MPTLAGDDNKGARSVPARQPIVLITGASSGLGGHFATLLASVGARVALAARRADRLGALVAEIEAAGGEARAMSLDVRT